jgi:uncharacterized protein
MSLLFKVDEIPEDGLEFSEQMEADWLTNLKGASGSGELEIEEPVKVSGRLERVSEDIRLLGRVRLKARTLCSRCGDEAIWPVDTRFEMVILPRSKAVLESEHQISPEEFNQAYYQGPEIDVSEYFREQITLEWPMQILCRPDCKGLCPRCGANLNYESCTCEKEEGDSRLAVLRNLKIENK